MIGKAKDAHPAIFQTGILLLALAWSSATVPAAEAPPAAASSAVQSAEGEKTQWTNTFEHPQGYYKLHLPRSWQAKMLNEEIVKFDTSVPGDMVLFIRAKLEEDEVGLTPEELLPSAYELADKLLDELKEVRSISPDARVSETAAGKLIGVTAMRGTIRSNSQPAQLWLSLVADKGYAYMLVSPLTRARSRDLGPSLVNLFSSLEVKEQQP